MSAKRISRQAAERMLRGRSAGHPAVADLFARASSQGRPDELAGEAEAVAAFQAALAGKPLPVPPLLPEERRSPRSPRTRALTKRAAVGSVLTVGVLVSGAALAAVGVPAITEHKEPKRPAPKTVTPTFAPKYAPVSPPRPRPPRPTWRRCAGRT